MDWQLHKAMTDNIIESPMMGGVGSNETMLVAGEQEI